MKKLFILLFSLLISFNSYGGTLDGKGLKCEHSSGNGHAGKTIYMWFEDGYFQIPYIEGSRISWQSFRYTEDGSKYIRFDKDDYHYKFKEQPWYFLKRSDVNRETLMLSTLAPTVYGNAVYKCSVQSYKSWIISDLQEKINTSLSTNKI
jgi:hypothetical protein